MEGIGSGTGQRLGLCHPTPQRIQPAFGDFNLNDLADLIRPGLKMHRVQIGRLADHLTRLSTGLIFVGSDVGDNVS